MKEKKNIDRLFQEKFKDFESEPHSRNWDNIASRLDNKNRKRPFVIPLWFKVGGVAAVIALIVSTFLFTQDQDPFSNEPGYVIDENDSSVQPESDQDSVNTEDSQLSSQESSEESGSFQSNSDENSGTNPAYAATNNSNINLNQREKNSSVSRNSATNSVADNSDSKISKNLKNSITSKNNSENTAVAENGSNQSKQSSDNVQNQIKNPSSDNPKSSNAIAVNQNDRSSEEKDALIKNPEEVKAEENALAQVEENNKLKDDETEEKSKESDAKKLRLSTFAAPVYYTNIGGGNQLSNQLAGNSSSSEVTLSYGVKVAYDLGKKLKIRTGISKVNMSYNIEDIMYSPSASSSVFDNINPVEDNLEIRNAPSPMGSGAGTQIRPAENGFTNLTNNIFTPGEINQQFGFIEVPVELEYALIDDKFGLNIIGGGSSLFLDANRVDLVAGEDRTQLGEASNINNTSFSTNIGLGMDYELSDKFSVSVEPILKYQINTFTDVSNVRPMNFGIYSGLNFKF